MKKYTEPEVEIVEFEMEDVITTSSKDPMAVGEEDWHNWGLMTLRRQRVPEGALCRDQKV